MRLTAHQASAYFRRIAARFPGVIVSGRWMGTNLVVVTAFSMMILWAASVQGQMRPLPGMTMPDVGGQQSGPTTNPAQPAPTGGSPRVAEGGSAPIRPSIPNTNSAATAPGTPPSVRAAAQPVGNGSVSTGSAAGPPRSNAPAGQPLPTGAGQFHKEYDLRPYTGYLTSHDNPQKAVLDWIQREVGTDVWFTEPFGFMTANRESLTVFHTPEMQDVIGRIVDRFVACDKDPQVMTLRVMTVGSPDWRTNTHHLMQHVPVDAPGVQAWLLTKENAALTLAALRARSDARQVQAVDLIMHNGQTEQLASARGRNYVRSLRPTTTGWPPYEPDTGQVVEGYRLSISPLLEPDSDAIDCVIRADIDQLDKLVPVNIDLPLPTGQVHRAQIEVPQVVSWRLHERFRWPRDMVLLLSCGVVASPDRQRAMIPVMDMLSGQTSGRADALLFIEFRGKASENLSTAGLPGQPAVGPQLRRGF